MTSMYYIFLPQKGWSILWLETICILFIVKIIYTIFVKPTFIIHFSFNNFRGKCLSIKEVIIVLSSDTGFGFALQLKLPRSSLTRVQSTCDFRYTFWENVVLGILKPIFTKNEIEEWPELPRWGSTKGSTTPGTSVSSRFRQLPSLWVGSLMSCVQPDRLAKSNASIPWTSVGLTDLSHSWWWAFRSPTKIKDDFLSNS